MKLGGGHIGASILFEIFHSECGAKKGNAHTHTQTSQTHTAYTLTRTMQEKRGRFPALNRGKIAGIRQRDPVPGTQQVLHKYSVKGMKHWLKGRRPGIMTELCPPKFTG